MQLFRYRIQVNIDNIFGLIKKNSSITATMVNLYSSLSRTLIFTFSNLITSTFHLVLPRSGFEEDCFCPVLFAEDSKYYDLKSCSCLNNTVFQNSYFNFCLTEDQKISFQIKNLTRNMNGSRLSIFHEFFCTRNFLPPYRIYTHSFEIAIGKSNINCKFYHDIH